MSDLISRQAASKFVLAFMVEYCGAAFDEYMQRGIEKAIAIIPSIEPEIIRCKDCTNFTQGKDEWGSCFENPMKMWRETDYCSWGERRQDEQPDRQTGGD